MWVAIIEVTTRPRPLYNAQYRGVAFPLRLRNLLTEVSDANLEAMGFPEDWKSQNIWCC